VERTYEIITQT